MRIERFMLSAALVLSTAAFSPVMQAQEQTQPSGLMAQFQKIEDNWSTALTHQDQYTLETILDPSFVGIAASGDSLTRNQVVANLFEKGEPRAQSLQQRVTDVRVIEDVAIVDGSYAETTKLNGVERREQGVFTHIFQRSRDVWKCVQAQRTPMPVAPDAGKKSRKKKSIF